MNVNILVKRVIIASAVLGAVAAAIAGLYYGPMSAISSVVGTILVATNFVLLARLAVTLLDDQHPNRRRAAVFLGVKFVALISIIGVLLINGIVRGGGFTAGFSAVVAAITLVGVFYPPIEDTNDSNNDSTTQNPPSGSDR